MEQAVRPSHDKEEGLLPRHHSVIKASLVNLNEQRSAGEVCPKDYCSDDDDMANEEMLSITNIAFRHGRSENEMHKAHRVPSSERSPTSGRSSPAPLPDDLIKKLYEWKEDKPSIRTGDVNEMMKMKYSATRVDSSMKAKKSSIMKVPSVKESHEFDVSQWLHEEQELDPAEMMTLKERILRLKEILKKDEVRLREESEWGKDAIQEIVKLNEIWEYLQHKIDSGGITPELEKQWKKYQRKLDETTKDLLEMRELYQKTDDELDRAFKELDDTKKRAKDLQQEIKESEETYKTIAEDLQLHALDLTSVDGELRQMKRCISQMEMMNEELTHKVNHLQEDAQNLTVIIDTLGGRMHFERSLIEQAGMRCQAAQNELEERQNIIDKLEEELLGIRRSQAEMEAESEQLQEQLDNLSAKMDKIMDKNHSRLQMSLHHERNSMADERMTVTQMQEDLVLLAYKIEAMKQEQIMLLKNLDVEKRTTEQLKVELIRQAHLADKFNDNLESAKRDVDKNAHKVKLLYTRIEEIKEDISKLSQECQVVRKRINEKDKAIEDTRQSSELKLDTMKKVVMLQQSRCEQDNKSFEKELINAQNEISDLHEQLTQKETQLATYAKALQEFQELSMYSFFKSTTLE